MAAAVKEEKTSAAATPGAHPFLHPAALPRIRPRRASTLPTADGDPKEEKKPFLTGLVSWLASKLIRKTARKVSGLNIDVGARSNGDVLAGNLPRVKVKDGRFFMQNRQM